MHLLYLKNIAPDFEVIRTIYHLLFSPHRKLFSALRNLLGFYPGNISLYHLAFSHRSLARETDSGIELSNERLEYLGDAVLGAIVSKKKGKGAIIGGVVGAAGGYIIGNEMDKKSGRKKKN